MTVPYYEADGVALYHGDAVRVLDALPAASVDALITDPPYSSGGMMRGDRTQDVHAKYVQSGSAHGFTLGAFSGDNRDQRAYLAWCTVWLGAALRVMKPGALAMLFTDWRQLPVTVDAIQAGGFVWRGIVPWHKPVNRPQSGRFSAACEYVVWGTAGPRPAEGAALPGFYSYSAPRTEMREHVTQKPLDLMRDLLAIVPPGGVVLDPFAGSGTTLLAARQRGLQAIGVEVTEHYCGIVADRLRGGDAKHRALGVADLFTGEVA